MNVQDVKRDLPVVEVDLGGRKLYAQVQGRRLRRAHVMFKIGGHWAYVEETWSKVAACVSRHKALIVEIPMIEGV